MFVRELDKEFDEVSDNEAAVVRDVDIPLREGKDRVSVEVAPVGAMLSVVKLPTIPGMEPLMTPGVEPLTTPGVEPSMMPGVEDIIAEVDRDNNGWPSSGSNPILTVC